MSSLLGQDRALLMRHVGGPHVRQDPSIREGDGHAVVVLCGEPGMTCCERRRVPRVALTRLNDAFPVHACVSGAAGSGVSRLPVRAAVT